MVRADIWALPAARSRRILDVINPLLLMLTYFFVFGVVLRSSFRRGSERSGFALYFLGACCRGWRSAQAAGRSPGGDAGAPQFFVKSWCFAVETAARHWWWPAW